MNIMEIEDLIGSCVEWQDAAATIRAAASKPLDAPTAALVEALDYYFPADDGPEAPFAPMSSAGGHRYPPSLLDANADRLDAWVAILGESSNPLIRSRLGDLLWVRRHGESFRHAGAAIEAYIARAQLVTDNDEIGLVADHRHDCLIRAMALARQLNSPLLDKAVALAISELDADLASTSSPGWAVGLLEHLAKLPASSRPDLGPQFRKARELYVSDPFISEAIIEAELSVTTDVDARRELQHDLVQRWVTAAENADVLVAQAHLVRAHEAALSLGLADALSDVRQRLAELAPATQSSYNDIGAEVQVPVEKVNAFID